jgi:REP element-mobilizing transposase RayT
MHFNPNEIYHIYNRRNQKQLVFFNDSNYIFFLEKIRKEWTKYAEILAYCLMPNHFHFMVVPNANACENVILGGTETHLQKFSKTIGNTLSSYTKAINIQNNSRGNLFQKKTKAKNLNDISINDQFSKRDYALNCFHYIHQNPKLANLVLLLQDWKYSSYPDYYGYRNGTLCNRDLAMKLLSLSPLDFKSDDFNLNSGIIQKIF